MKHNLFKLIFITYTTTTITTITTNTTTTTTNSNVISTITKLISNNLILNLFMKVQNISMMNNCKRQFNNRRASYITDKKKQDFVSR